MSTANLNDEDFPLNQLALLPSEEASQSNNNNSALMEIDEQLNLSKKRKTSLLEGILEDFDGEELANTNANNSSTSSASLIKQTTPIDNKTITDLLDKTMKTIIYNFTKDLQNVLKCQESGKALFHYMQNKSLSADLKMNFKPYQYASYFGEDANTLKKEEMEAWSTAQHTIIKIRFDGHVSQLKKLSISFDSKYKNKSVINQFNTSCESYLANDCISAAVTTLIKKYVTDFEVERTRLIDTHKRKNSPQQPPVSSETATTAGTTTTTTSNTDAVDIKAKDQESINNHLMSEVERLKTQLEKFSKPSPPPPKAKNTSDPKNQREPPKSRSQSKDRPTSPEEYTPAPFNPNKFEVHGNYKGKNYNPNFVKENYIPEKNQKTWGKDSRRPSGQVKEQATPQQEPQEARGRSRTRAASKDNDENDGEWTTKLAKKKTTTHANKSQSRSPGRSGSSNSRQANLQTKSSNTTTQKNNRVVELRGDAEEK